MACVLPVAALFLARPAAPAPQAQSGVAAIDFDYPSNGSLFPPDIGPPTFLWRETKVEAAAWQIKVTFADQRASRKSLTFSSAGGPPPAGEIDEQCLKAGAELPKPEEGRGSLHSWQPGEKEWETIKQFSVAAPAEISVTGYADAGLTRAVAQGAIRISTSRDPVGAPIFFRDVPLISVPVGEKGVIMPLPTEAIPLIAWRLRWINEKRSRLMMSGLPTCVNCHSFARDGKTMGLDVDGPGNDKGLYGIVPLGRETAIKNENVIRWSKFSEEKATKRFGFMSQISPDGRYVVTNIEDPGAHVRGLDSRFYNGFYRDYGFGQVFYPTRGILAWYDRTAGKLQPLPGANDPNYV